MESAEVLAAAMAEAEIPLRAIIEAFHGSWEQLLDVDDRIWLAKVATSSQRTISYEIKVADGSVREVLVDRVQNLNSIIRWLLFDQKDEDDPSGCFRIIKARLFETIPKLIDDPIGKQAWEIESQLNTEIKDISLNVVQLKLESKAFKDADLHHSLEAFLGLVLPPIMENGDAASALLYLRKEIEQQRAELLQNVTTWLDSGKESDDPSGEFRQVSMLPLGRSVAASDVVDKTKEERASEICARVASLRNVISYFEYERAGVRTTSTSSSLQEQQHCPHKTMDPIEHELFDSLAMLHSSGSVPLSVKAPSNFCHSTKEMRNSFSRKISRMHDVSSPLVQNTTSATSKSVDSSSAVNIRGQECPDLCAPSLLVQNSNGVSLEPSRPPRVSPNSGLLDAGQSEDHSSSSSSPKKQENEATSTASHAPPLAEPCVDAEQDACSSAQQHSTPSKDSILTLDSDSEEAEAAVVTEDSSTTDVFSEASRKCGKRKHKGSDSLSTTLPDSPVAEVSTTLEQDSGKKSINERKKKNLFSVSVLEESAQKKRKVESEFQSEIPVTKRIGINERWQEEKQHSSPRIIPPSKAGVIPKEVPGIVVLEPNNAIPQTTLKTISTTESRKRVNHQMFDILGRLRNRDDALDSFVRAAGTTREEYNSWMECFSRSHGPHRAALLDRVCRWFGSNRQFAESSWERTIFELLNQHVVGQENSERAVMIEYVMFTLQERIDEFKGSTANGCLKETLSRHIQNLISSHNPTTNPIHFPLPPPTGRIVTPREQVITSYATCQPLIHRAHDSMDHFSSPQLVGVNPDNISDIHS